MKQIRDLLIGPKEPDLKNVGWVSFDKNTQKYELKFYINGRWLPIVSNIDTIEPEKIEKVKELIEWINNNGTDFNNSKVSSITWNNDTNPSNMNDFVVAGVYDIKGERTRGNDNLPITNTGGGHSFNARLTVLDSSISGSGRDDDKCITQILSLSNRLGQGEICIRTGKGSSLNNLTWEKWSTLQRNVNVDNVESLDDLKDNGIYSGVWLRGHYNSYPITFVCVVINDYFIGIAPKRISQFVYGLSKFDGSVVYQSRVWDDSKDKWGDWEILNKKELSSMISSEISKIVDNAPETFDTLKEIADWINNDESGAAAMLKAINENKSAIKEESERASGVENVIAEGLNRESSTRLNSDNDIKSKAALFGSTLVRPNTNSLDIKYQNVNQETTGTINIPSATIESAGVMSAEDKVALDTATSRALRALFIAAGAEYNDTGADKTKTAPWGDTVIHKAGHYYLNGLGDITEEQMMEIYNAGMLRMFSTDQYSRYKVRTNIPMIHNSGSGFQAPNMSGMAMGNGKIECFVISTGSPRHGWSVQSLYRAFDSCKNLKYILSPINASSITNATTIYGFENCTSLLEVYFYNLKANLNFKDSSMIYKKCIVDIVQKASPTSAITITLHPDAYARIANQPDILEALEAQPLVTLVSA